MLDAISAQNSLLHCTEVRFISLLSGGFNSAILVNPPERKQAKRTSVHCILVGKPSVLDQRPKFYGRSRRFKTTALATVAEL